MKQYNAKYDAYYDDEQNVWLESTCGNERCEYCGNRPATPLEVPSIDSNGYYMGDDLTPEQEQHNLNLDAQI